MPLISQSILDDNVFQYKADYYYPDDSEAQAIIKSNDIYIDLDNEFFVFIPEKGYFLVVYDGTNFSLLKKLIKKYYLPRESSNTYDKGSPPTFSDRHDYYIYTKEGAIYEFPDSKKKKLAVFGDKSNEIKKYCSDNNLNEEKDLKKAILYLDTL